MTNFQGYKYWCGFVQERPYGGKEKVRESVSFSLAQLGVASLWRIEKCHIECWKRVVKKIMVSTCT